MSIKKIFMRGVERLVAGDQTYRDWVEKVLRDAHGVARGDLQSVHVDPAYRELVIDLVHLDSDLFARAQSAQPTNDVLNKVLLLLRPSSSRKEVSFRQQPASSPQQHSPGSRGCGCGG